MEAVAPSNVKTLVVIRFSALGDVALIVPVLLAFSESYPNCRLVVCTRARFAPLFQSVPNSQVLSAHLEAEHKGLFGLYRLNKLLRNTKPTHILDLHNVLRTRVLHTFNRLGSIAFHILDKGRAEKQKLVRSTQKVWLPLPHTTQRYGIVFKEAGFPVFLTGDHILPTRSIQDQALRSSLEGNLTVGIAPFAAHKAKMYDLDLLEKVIAWLNTKPNCKILIFGGGKKEQEHAQPWDDKYSNCTNLIGRYNFEEELNIISQLDLMLSMDSGNGHLSAIFGVPTLTLWGVTHPYAGFAPFGQPETNSLLADRNRFPAIPTSIYGNRYPQGYENAINTIPVSQIQERIRAILGWN